MGRTRNDFEGSWHHVMNRGAGRQPVFITKADGVEFERLLGVAHERFGVEVHAYCLMSNHYHLLLHCPSGGLSDFMQYVSSVYTRHINERQGIDGALFRGRFHSLAIGSTEYLVRAARYIHRNPLDISPPPSIADYRWSSHRVYLGHRACPAWARTGHLLEMFDFDRGAFDEFVGGTDPGERPHWSSSQLTSLIDLIVDEQHDLAEGSAHWYSRTVAVALLEVADEPMRELLEEHLVFRDQKARRAAQRRAEIRLAAVPELKRVVRRVRDLAA